MIEEDKHCSTCGIKLTDDTWLPSHQRCNRYICKMCSRERTARYAKNHSFDQRLRRKIRTTLDAHRKDGHDIVGNVSEFMITYTGECALCGEEFNIYDDDIRKRGSLDRINNETIITPDNIQWLCYSCNTGKQDMTNEEYIAKCKRIVEREVNRL